MCPDKKLLSIYFDNELPEPFKEKIANHIAQCPHCSSALAAFSTLSFQFDDKTIPQPLSYDFPKDRIWSRLQKNALANSTKRASASGLPRGFFRKRPFWRYEVRLPAPLAAAAALLVIGSLALIILRPASHPETSEILAADMTSEELLMNESPLAPVFNDDTYGASPKAVKISMQDVVQYLENEGDSNIIIIKLPESKSFNHYGQPRLLNTTYYNGER